MFWLNRVIDSIVVGRDLYMLRWFCLKRQPMSKIVFSGSMDTLGDNSHHFIIKVIVKWYIIGFRVQMTQSEGNAMALTMVGRR